MVPDNLEKAEANSQNRAYQQNGNYQPEQAARNSARGRDSPLRTDLFRQNREGGYPKEWVVPHREQRSISNYQGQQDISRRNGLITDHIDADESQDKTGEWLPYPLMKIRREPFLDELLHGWADQCLEWIGRTSQRYLNETEINKSRTESSLECRG